MATNTINLPPGFTLDAPTDPNVPSGFVLDKQAVISQTQRPTVSGLDANAQLQLIDELRGSLPLSQQPPTGLPISPETKIVNPEKEKVFQQLIQSGVSKEQIQTVLDIQKRVSPGIIGQIKQNIGEDVGGLAGGIAGAGLALKIGQIPPLTALSEEFVTVPIGAAIGAFLAGGAGKTVQQAVDPLATPSIGDFVKSGRRQALFEGVGRLASAATRLLPIFKKPLKESQDVAEMFAKQGGFFTPRQRDARTVIRASEELSRGSFGGGAIFEGFDIDMQARALNAGKEVIDTIARDAVKDPDLLGNELVALFARKGEIVGGKRVAAEGARETLLDEFFEVLYKEVGRLSPNTRLSTLPIKTFIQKKLKQNTAQGGALLTREGESQFKRILRTLETRRTLNQMRDLVSSYKKDARKFAVGADKSETAFIELAAVADQALFDPTTVIGMTPEAKKLLRNINAVYGPSREIYGDQFIKSVISQIGVSPSKTVKVVFKDFDHQRLKNIRDLLISPVPVKGGTGDISRNIQKEFRVLRETLPNIKGGEGATRLISKNAAEGRALWRQLNANWFSEQLKSSFNPTTGMLDVKKLNKAIESIPPKTFRLMFPGTAGKSVKDIQKLFNVLSPAKRGFVSMFGKTIELGGITAAGGAAGAAITLQAGSGIAIVGASGSLAISMTPTAFAKLATNPKATKALTLGLSAKRGSVKVAPLAARLINLLNEDARNEQLAILKGRRKPKKKRTFTQVSGFGGVGGGRF